MKRYTTLGLLAVLTVVGPVLAQQTPPSAPAVTSATPSNAPTNPDLKVASVKMQDVVRLSKLIGSSVYNEQNDKVGSLDDLITKGGDTIVMAIVSVGGFLGIGNKLVAVPYDQLHLAADKEGIKVELPGTTKACAAERNRKAA